MNWNIFNAGWDKILHLISGFVHRFANIGTFVIQRNAEILFLRPKNPQITGLFNHENLQQNSVIGMVADPLILWGFAKGLYTSFCAFSGQLVQDQRKRTGGL